MASFETNILILCKTYPSPSGKHIKTSCVAGMSPRRIADPPFSRSLSTD